MRPVVVAVAITGSVPRKKDNPAVPITVSEQIESTHEAFGAGASLVHIHVRNPDETPSSDPKLFAQVMEGVRRHCPGMIVQFSTGGRGRDPSARGSALFLRPDMASLSTGSVNFPSIVYENSPSLIEELATKMREHGTRPEIEIFDFSGTAIRNFVFQEASGEFVVCMDCHVLIVKGALKRLMDYFDAHPQTDDLLQGPMIYDNLTSYSTHFKPGWCAGMYGTWDVNPAGADPDQPPFEIPMQGL